MTACRILLVLFISIATVGVSNGEVLYADVPVSDGGTSNTIASPNTSRNVAVGPTGIIYVSYRDDSAIYVARSTNRGESFETPVQVADVSYEAEIGVDADGIVHVVWGTGTSAYYTQSTDEGVSFSTPTEIGEAVGTMHIALDAPYVYLINRGGQTLLHNSNSGDGAFIATTVDSGRAYSDVHVDPATGYVYVQTDDPVVRVFKSTDHGASFDGPHEPGGSVYYSTTVLASTGDGVFLYTSGTGTDALRIDVSDYSQTELTFGNTTISQGRTLAVDAYSNVIDGYVDGTDVKYAISEDNGVTFGDVVTIATGAYLSLGLNSLYGDIVAVYEADGAIYATIYAGELTQPPGVSTNEVSDLGATTATCGGEVVTDGGETVTARGVCWSTDGTPTIDDDITSDGTGLGTFTSSLTGLTTGTTYYVRAYATNSVGTGYGSKVTFTTLDRVPDLQVTITAGSTTAAVGQELAFEIDVQNAGTGDATDVTLTLPLPAGTEFVSASLVEDEAAQSTPLTASVVDDDIVIELGDLAVDEELKIELILRATATGTVSLDAAATSNEQTTAATAQAADVEVDEAYWEMVRPVSIFDACGALGLATPLLTMLGLLTMKGRRGRRS